MLKATSYAAAVLAAGIVFLMCAATATAQVVPQANVMTYCGASSLVAGSVSGNQMDQTGAACARSPNGSSSLTANQVNVGTSATLIISAGQGPFAAKTVCNFGTVAVYLGGSGVTTSNGGIVIGGVGNPPCWDFSHFPGAVYGIVATGNVEVGYAYY